MRFGVEGVRTGDCDVRRSCHGRGVCGVALRLPDEGCDADLGVRDHDGVMDRPRENSRPRPSLPPLVGSPFPLLGVTPPFAISLVTRGTRLRDLCHPIGLIVYATLFWVFRIFDQLAQIF